MKYSGYICDNCGEKSEKNPKVTIGGNFTTPGGGIILPRESFEFCSLKCLLKWLESVKEN